MSEQKIRFRKSETKKYACAINQLRERGDRDFWATLYGAGLTFVDEIERFARYCKVVEARDIYKELEPRFGHEHRYYANSRQKKENLLTRRIVAPKYKETIPFSRKIDEAKFEKDKKLGTKIWAGIDPVAWVQERRGSMA